MKIGDIVYVVDPFLMETRRCRILGEEQLDSLSREGAKSFWKTKDFIDRSVNYSCKETTFKSSEEANEYIEKALNLRLKTLIKVIDTKEGLVNYLYSLAVVNEIDNKALEYLEKKIREELGVEVGG